MMTDEYCLRVTSDDTEDDEILKMAKEVYYPLYLRCWIHYKILDTNTCGIR
jgi:hypothetical protein